LLDEEWLLLSPAVEDDGVDDDDVDGDDVDDDVADGDGSDDDSAGAEVVLWLETSSAYVEFSGAVSVPVAFNK
jgi:hypothetical protein